MSLLSQSSLDRLGLARWPMRRAVHGTRQGAHRSPYTGASAEFAQHREYAVGDELRRVDWRVLARTDRLMVKQYDQETNVRATILVDASASMGYVGKKKGAIRKLTQASRLAAGLAWVLMRQGDGVSLVVGDHQIRQQLPVGSTMGHLQRLLRTLEGLQPHGPSNFAGVIHTLAESAPARGLMILLTDGLEEPATLQRALHHLHFRNHEVLLLQVLSSDELEFPFQEAHRFRDLEDGLADCDVDPTAIRRQYLAAVTQHLSAIRQACHQVNAEYLLTSTEEDSGTVLVDFFAQRSGLPSSGGGRG